MEAQKHLELKSWRGPASGKKSGRHGSGLAPEVAPFLPVRGNIATCKKILRALRRAWRVPMFSNASSLAETNWRNQDEWVRNQ